GSRAISGLSMAMSTSFNDRSDSVERSSRPRSVVAVFDFDGTLTCADSFLPFLREASGLLGFWWGLTCLTPLLAGVAAGRIPRQEAKEHFLRHYLKGWTPQELDVVAARFVRGRLRRLLRPWAMERVRWHQRQGHRVLLLSASPENYLRPWAGTV